MGYTMKIYVDGGCRGNGSRNAIGAAAAIQTMRWGRKYWVRTQRVETTIYQNATNQRAELSAIILGLLMALDRYHQLNRNPRLRLTIYSDSKYAVNCMTECWINGSTMDSSILEESKW
jgi:ribonuclease HI